MSAKTECDYCGENCYGGTKLVEDNGMFGERSYDFCRLTCLLDYILERRMETLEYGRKIEANMELGLDAWGGLPELRKHRDRIHAQVRDELLGR